MKIFRSKKALSPVVASIILIAVTVAVSIAVAAWMGALTVGFMGSSSVTVNDVTFTDTNAALDLKNTGTKLVTIVAVRVNGGTKIPVDPVLSLAAGETTGTTPLDVTGTYTAGDPYRFELYDASGQVIGSYEARYPQ